MATPARQIDLLTKFILHTRAEPVIFAREVLNHRVLPGEPTIEEDPKRSWELDIFQCDLLEAAADVWRKIIGEPTRINHTGCPHITVRSGRGPGKTHTAALIAYWFNTAFQGRVIATAPKLAQLRSRVWTALRRIDARAEAFWRATHVIHDTSVNWIGVGGKENKDWTIIAETATHPENMSGLHMPFQMILVEEATGIAEPLFVPIIGATGLIMTIWIYISNPTKQVGTFAASHLKASEAANHFRYHINLKNARRIDRDWARRMESKYGANSPIVKINVHGEFSDASARQLIPTAWAMDAIAREPRGPDGAVRKLRVIIDVADGGTDETVIWVKEIWGSFEKMIKMKRFNFAAVDAIAQAADAAEIMFNEASGNKVEDEFIVDSLGVGAGTRDFLIRRGYNVIEYMGGSGSDDPTRWRNRRVQSYLCFRDAIRDGELDFATDCFDTPEDTDEFLAQLASIELTDSVTGERLEDLVTKAQMKREGKQSPDIADGAAMSYATQRPVRAVPDGQNLRSQFHVEPGYDNSGMNIGGAL